VQNWLRDFIIIADDDSPWAHGLRCSRLRRAVTEADSERGFAPDYRKAFDAAVAAAHAQGCAVLDDDE
jgi:hypothetical protein